MVSLYKTKDKDIRYPHLIQYIFIKEMNNIRQRHNLYRILNIVGDSRIRGNRTRDLCRMKITGESDQQPAEIVKRHEHMSTAVRKWEKVCLLENGNAN